MTLLPSEPCKQRTACMANDATTLEPSLPGKVALFTGGGLGLAISRQPAARRAHAIFPARNAAIAARACGTSIRRPLSST